MKTLIIGYGEIGKSLYSIFSKYYEVQVIDKKEKARIKPEIIHICFPYSKDFIKEVKKYQEELNPKFTVIHSTVPVGTSSKCGAIHSPVVGLHPHLEESIETFTKFLGGEKAGEVADYFRKAGIKVYITDKSETTELMKIMSTTYYATCVEYTKEVKRLCDKNKIPFEMWTLWTNNYNEGYDELGYPQYIRPNLIPNMKKIGGHCLIPNLDLIDSKFAEFIRSLNGK